MGLAGHLRACQTVPQSRDNGNNSHFRPIVGRFFLYRLPLMAQTEEPQWLSVEQQKIWRNWLQAVARIDGYLDTDLRRFGLDLGEYEILVCLSEAEGRRLRMSELADLVHQSRSRLTHAVSRMEKQGLVKRTSAAEDRRGVVCHLTAPGFELLEAAAPSHVAAVRRILVDAMPAEDFLALGRAMDAVLAVAD